MNIWYDACSKVSSLIQETIPLTYHSRSFSGIIGDIKALPPKKALSLISRKKGLGLQYAYLYLTEGIDSGRGYQACATEALQSVMSTRKNEIIHGSVLDVGCAVGVTAGIMGLHNVTGFDLFTDLLRTAQHIDTLIEKQNRYIVADMAETWPFCKSFNTVICGLVCHHLKKQNVIVTFFSEANRVLNTEGSLIITLPSGSIATQQQLRTLVNAVESFGFLVDNNLTGLVLSTDSKETLFWMFLITLKKVSADISSKFITPEFAFPQYRLPVTREEKGEKIKQTKSKKRQVKHGTFRLITIDELGRIFGNTLLTFDNLLQVL